MWRFDKRSNSGYGVLNMANWKNFEINAKKYLEDNVLLEGIFFQQRGGTDSTVPDILVRHYDHKLFYIECKIGAASQAAQFVVLNDTKEATFYYSPRNEGEKERAKVIIDHMNQYYDQYQPVSGVSKGISLDVPQDVMFDSIKSFYRSKNVAYFISDQTMDESNPNFCKVMRLEDIGKHFNVTGVFRPKRSGTSPIPMKDRNEFLDTIRHYDKNSKLVIDQSKTFLRTSIHLGGQLELKSSAQGKGHIVPGDRYDFYLARIDSNYFEVKRRAKTLNANVIFTLVFNPRDSHNGIAELKRELRQLM